MAVKPIPIQIDPKTVEAAKNGDQFAVSELYEKCYNTIYYVVKSIIVEEDTSQDIVQDAFMRAFNNLDKLSNPASFVPWMKRLATNMAKDWLKKKKPILFSSMYPDDAEEEDITDPEIEDVDLTQQPEEALDAKTKKALLWNIINSLSDEQRLVVSMFYFQEMSVASIAEDLGVSQSTIKSRLNYARKRIEAKVLDLEKQGTKLYGLAPIPFLLWLFMQNQQVNTVMAAPIAIKAVGAGSDTIASSAAKTATTATAKTAGKAAAKGIGVKIAVGAACAAVVAGGVAVGVNQLLGKSVPESGYVYSWYREPDVQAEDINMLIQEVPDVASIDTEYSDENMQRMFTGGAWYIKTPEGVGIITYDDGIITPTTYSTVSMQESFTIVLTDDTGEYTVSLDTHEITPYQKPDIQARLEKLLAKEEHVRESSDVGVFLWGKSGEMYLDGVAYYDAGTYTDGIYAVENDSMLWGYFDNETETLRLPIQYGPAWYVDTSVIDISPLNHYRMRVNSLFNVTMEDQVNLSGKGSFQTERAYDVSEGFVVVNIPGEGYSLITIDGETVIPAGEYAQLRPVCDSRLWAQKEEGGEWGILQLEYVGEGS